jgi:hypothetical protein
MISSIIALAGRSGAQAQEPAGNRLARRPGQIVDDRSVREHALMVQRKRRHRGHAIGVSTAIWYPSGPSTSW